MKSVNVAVVGATGLVGGTILKVLEERNFKIDNLYLFSSERSAGEKVIFQNKEYIVEELNENSFNKDIQIALFAAGGEISKKYAEIAAKNGIIVIDNSSHFRMNEDVPLVVPEVNPEDCFKNRGIIANPNCSTIQAVVAIKPLHDKYTVKRIVYSTYQAVSGSGLKGIDDLRKGLNGEENTNYPHQIANNCLPHIDSFCENGYTKEEIKMIEETRKILHSDNMKVTATTVRVPVFDCHSESINIEFEKEFDINELTALLKQSPSIVVENDSANNNYPMAITAKGLDDVFVGRIRRDHSLDSGINIWVVADNIRKGAATNAVQIAEILVGGMKEN